ncbi:ArnT family glycosyltransferase [endosymbiont of Riftia pachyptila]|nr:glycosyltransferase family 39 protein [endosymbiont of Riftia pachyptila]
MTIERHDRWWLLLLVVALVPLHALLIWAANIELNFDEAHYWEWSQHLDWSYYSKGPLIALAIALPSELFGQGDWQVRLMAWLSHGLLLVLLFHFARDLWQSRAAGWWAVLLGLSSPLFFMLGSVMTTDSLLFPFWTWALWAAVRALQRGQSHAWYEMGIAVGIGALAKFSIALLPTLIALLMLTRAEWRQQFLKPHPWLGALLALAIVSPVLIWNSQHDWVMFRHEQGHMAGGGIGNFFEVLLGQPLALSPLLGLVMIATLVRRPQQPEAWLVRSLTLMLMVFFLWKSFGGKVQLNWPAPIHIGVIVLFAGYAGEWFERHRRFMVAGLLAGMLVSILVPFPQLFGLPLHKSYLKKTQAWRESIATLAAQAGPVDFLIASHYHLASELAFYWPQRLPVYPLPSGGGRFTQYHLWPGLEREQGRSALYVTDYAGLAPALLQAFAECKSVGSVPAVTAGGGVVRTLHGWRCRDYRHIDWPQPSRY